MAILEKNARMDRKELAAILGEPEDAVAAEITAMEKEKHQHCLSAGDAGEDPADQRLFRLSEGKLLYCPLFTAPGNPHKSRLFAP